MKKFCVALVLLLSFLATPVFANTCKEKCAAENMLDHHKKTSDSKDKESKMKDCSTSCHQHCQENRILPKDYSKLEVKMAVSSFSSFYQIPTLSIITGPLLEPPSA